MCDARERWQRERDRPSLRDRQMCSCLFCVCACVAGGEEEWKRTAGEREKGCEAPREFK